MLRAVIIVSVLVAQGCHAAGNSSTVSVKQTTSKQVAAQSRRQSTLFPLQPLHSPLQPVPGGPRQPEPSPRQPALLPQQPAPTPRQPSPSPRQPSPSPWQPAPSSRQPAPSPRQPVPSPQHSSLSPRPPAPSTQQPAPPPPQLAPSSRSLAPSRRQPTPSPRPPAQSLWQPAPPLRQPAPSSWSLAPSRRQPPPSPRPPAQSLWQPAPSSRQPAPSSRSLAQSHRQPAPSPRPPAPLPRQPASSPRQPAPSPRPPAPLPRQQAPPSRPPAPVASLKLAARRSSSDLVESLRRQLMRDNYDYQNTNTDDERLKERQFQNLGSNTHSYLERSANEQVGSNVLKDNTHKAHNMHPRGGYKAKAKQKTAFRHNPIAPGRAPEWHNPYDATYSRDTRVALGPRYSPDTLYPHKRHGHEPDEPNSRAGPVVRAGTSEEAADMPPPAVQHPYELPTPSNSVEAQDSGSVQKPNKRRQRPVQRSQPIDHPISKKDLLYYMDDVHLRRNNDVSELSGSESDAEEAPYGHSHALHHTAGRNRRAGADAEPDQLPRASSWPNPDKLVQSRIVEPNPSANVIRFAAVTEQQSSPADASAVSLTDSCSSSGEASSAAPEPAVTGAGASATYKLLRVRSRRAGRRAGGGARRLLEERGAAGVALIRLDGAPFPQFRLPRSRRQYMRDHHHGW